jgi:hypothetical protein
MVLYKKHEKSIKKQATWPAQTDLFESQKRDILEISLWGLIL